MSESELKPCPFCGEQAVFSNEFGRQGASCSGCGVSFRPFSIADYEAQKAESIEVWNTRAPTDARTPTEMELREALEQIKRKDYGEMGNATGDFPPAHKIADEALSNTGEAK